MFKKIKINYLLLFALSYSWHAMADHINYTPNELINTFDLLDTNKNKMLEVFEFKAQNRDIFEHVDINLDNKLSSKEFKAYFSYQNRIIKERKNIKNEQAHLNIAYVENGHRRQKLDLYIPDNLQTKPMPLVIWIHGGGWKRGTKLLLGKQIALLEQGFILASINYRLSRHDTYPAQLHDVKAAIRFLRHNAKTYGIDPNRIGIWGASAGGHLAALAATTGDDASLEGSLGVTNASSKVQAAVIWYGPSDMLKMFERRKNSLPIGTNLLRFPVPKLFGGTPETHGQLYCQGSAINYVTPNDPPFLIMHANKDPIVPLDQSKILHQSLTDNQVSSEFHIVEGSKHDFFRGDEEHKILHQFLTKKLINN